jgi:hypothetical protein
MDIGILSLVEAMNNKYILPAFILWIDDRLWDKKAVIIPSSFRIGRISISNELDPVDCCIFR